MKETVGRFERVIEWTPAYDKRNADPKKDYGVHGMTLRFLLIGPLGVMQFVIYTNWMLPHVEKWLDARSEDEPRFRHLSCHPIGANIGYHSPVVQYEGQKPPPCEYLPGGTCYYDGTSLGASEFLPVFIAKGEPAVWEMLEQRYAGRFEEASK